MAGYIGSGASVVSSGVENKKVFDITTNTTSLTGLNYTVGKVHVYHNGVRLVDGTDYTANNSTSITLTVAAVSGDQVVVVSFASFQVSDALPTAGGTLTGDLSFGDNDKAIFGAGSDLQIHHSNSDNNSYITETGSGSLVIAADQLYIQNAAKTETKAIFTTDGEVSLRHNDDTKFTTTSTGATIRGDGDAILLMNTASDAGDKSLIRFGDNDDADAGYIDYDHGTNSLAFGVNAAERMRIDSKGMVGIKYSMPSNVSGDCTSIRVGGLTTLRGVTNTTGAQNFQTGLTYNSYPTSSGTDKAYVSKGLGSDFKPVKYAQVAGNNIWYNASTATAGSDITWTERMRIDPEGRVTKPYQPSFFAYLNGFDFTGVGLVPFNNTTYNIGNHFNTSNGRFTVPVTGVYMFTVIMTSGTTQTARHQFLTVNGNRYRDMFEGDDFVTNSERHASVNIRLTANDVVDFRNGVTMTVQGGNYNHNSAFMGHLLG